MTARALLVRGLLVGLLAGFATFLVAHQVGEPHVETAIALEEAGAAAEPTGTTRPPTTATRTRRTAPPSPAHDQRTWGLLTGTLVVGTALGGIVALLAAAAVGRLGRMTPGQSTATVALIGFVSFALVPFLKYPATPPAVGNGETIGDRTSWYFAFLLVSLAFAALSTLLAVRVSENSGAYVGVAVRCRAVRRRDGRHRPADADRQRDRRLPGRRALVLPPRLADHPGHDVGRDRHRSHRPDRPAPPRARRAEAERRELAASL